MYRLLALFFIMHGLHASTPSQLFEREIEDELLECIYSSLPPKRYETPNTSPSVSPPNCSEIVDERFMLSPVQQNFIPEVAAILKNRKVMKFYGTGRPIGLKEVEGRIKRLERQLHSEQNPTSRGWVIMTREGVCGVIFTYPSKLSSPTQQVSEIARILAPSVQGKGLGSAVLNVLFDDFPDIAWSGKSHPQNIASRKSRENVGFTYVETKYDEQDRAIRRFDQRPSNNEIEGRTQIRFSYSGDIVSLASLEHECADQCLRETQSSADKSRTHFSPIEVAPSKRISPVGVDELIHELSQSE